MDLREQVEPVLCTCTACKVVKSCRSYEKLEVKQALKSFFGRPEAFAYLHSPGHRRYFCKECVQ